MSTRFARTLAVVAALLGAFRPAVAAGQASGQAAVPGEPCPAGRVTRIEIRNYSLFAPDDIAGKRFGWALSMANAAHIRTRAEYVRDQLLFDEGDCFDQTIVDSSVRFLRELDFIARVQATPHQQPDGSWSVRMETWDEWSTSASVYFDVEGELQIQGFYVTEINTLGRGLRLSFRHRSFRERNDNSLTLSSTRFLGTPTQAAIAAGTTRIGGYFRQDFTYPLQGESSRLYFQSHLQFEEREESYLTQDEEGLTHVLLPLTEKTLGLAYRRRFGVPGALTLLGGEMQILRRTVAGRTRQVVDRDFENATLAPDSIAARLRPQDDPDSWVRLGATAGVRRIEFATARGLDLVSGLQNVAVGTEATVTLGRVLGTWDTSALGSYGAFDFFVSGMTGDLVANTLVHAEGRLLDARPTAGASRWRDLQLTGRSLLWLQPGDQTVQTLVLGSRYRLRRNVDQPFQAALGGEQGVRGYREDQVPTGTTWVNFVEERLNLPWFKPAVDVGLIAFADYGRGWAHGVPFGIDTGWRSAFGGGLRLGFPAGSGTITHLEIAWPKGPGSAGRGPIFRTYFSPVETSR